MVSASPRVSMMHNAMLGTTGMDHEPHLAHDDSQYSQNSNWVDVEYVSGSISDFGNFSYVASTSGLTSDALARIAPSPTSSIQPHVSQPQGQAGSTQQSPQTSHPPQLPILPMQSWPSMLTNPVPYPGQIGIPAVAPPPVAASVPATTKPSRSTSSTPRRTLTDDDRRRMCRYHEENPTAKQLDIGRMFGVERR